MFPIVFFDCMNIHQAGFPNVVALMGSSVSAVQQKFICQFRRVALFLDGDDAGRQATSVIASTLLSQTFVRVVQLGAGRQPDALSSDEIRSSLSF